MERTGEENGPRIKSSASEPKHITDGVTHLRAIAADCSRTRISHSKERKSGGVPLY